MAKFEINGLTDYRESIAKLNINTDGILKQAVYEGAAIVIEAVKANTPVDSGDLRDSIGLSKMQNDDGFINTKLGFAGYDENGTPNIVKVRVLESGSSTRKKHPFIRPAVNRVRQTTESIMAAKVAEEINKIMK